MAAVQERLICVDPPGIAVKELGTEGAVVSLTDETGEVEPFFDATAPQFSRNAEICSMAKTRKIFLNN